MSKTIITRDVMALIYLDPTDLLTKYGIVGSGIAELIDVPDHNSSIHNYRATNLEVFIIPATEGTWNKEKTNG